MEDKSKLFVFDKKEVLLIFIFILVIASTAFTVGVRMGMKWQLEKEGVTAKDMEAVKLKSQNEEYADKILKEDEEEKKVDIKEEANKRLQEEIEKAGKGVDGQKLQEEIEVTPEVNASINKSGDEKNLVKDSGSASLIDSYGITDEKSVNSVKEEVEDEAQIKEVVETDSIAASLKGKYTVQVGAYKTMDEAKSFAGGFEVRGYTPIVHEVKIPGKGTWYRVSIGAFNNRNEAKDYIVKEKTLFQSYDYLIKQID